MGGRRVLVRRMLVRGFRKGEIRWEGYEGRFRKRHNGKFRLNLHIIE